MMLLPLRSPDKNSHFLQQAGRLGSKFSSSSAAFVSGKWIKKFGAHKIPNCLRKHTHTHSSGCKDICQRLVVQQSGNLVLDQNLRQGCEDLLRWCSVGQFPLRACELHYLDGLIFMQTLKAQICCVTTNHCRESLFEPTAAAFHSYLQPAISRLVDEDIMLLLLRRATQIETLNTTR